MSIRGSDHNLAPAGRVGSRALAAGTTAVYPGQGPCRIGRIVEKIVDGRAVMFYHLLVLSENGGELFIPVEKARAIGLRLLIKKSEIPKLLTHLQKSAKAADNWKQRASDNSKLFNSGSPFDLAEIVASLTELGDTRSLTLTESRTLDKARKLLVCEISVVIGEEKTAVEGRVDKLLKARRDQTQPQK